MPATIDQREAITAVLADFAGVGGAASPSTSSKQEQATPATFPDTARRFFATLGYQSDRRLHISHPDQFCAQLDPNSKLTER